MARYDYESTQQYAEQAFDKAKKYNEEQVKKQEKFAKRLLTFDTAVKGANFLINQRADELESSFGPAKSKYKSYVQNAEATTTYWNQVNQQGGVDYLQKQIYDSYLNAAKEVKPFEEVKNISGWIYNEATTKANELYSALEKTATQAKSVPTLEDFIKDYEKFEDIQAPRTLFGAATKGIKRILGRENSETLEYKKNIAKEKLFNTDVIKEIDEFAELAETYDKLGYDTPGLIRKMEAQFKKNIGKKIQSSELKEYKYPIAGTNVEKHELIDVIRYEDGSVSTNVILSNDSVNTDLVMTEAAEVSLLMKVKPEAQDEVIKILKKGGKGQALKTNVSEAVAWLNKNNGLKVEITDLKGAIDVSNALYQAELQGKFDKETNMPMVKMNDETREYEVLPTFMPQAIKEGWDKKTYIQRQLDNMQMNYEVNQYKKGNINDELINTTSIESQITDPSKLKEFNSVIENPNSNVYKFTQFKIKNKTSGTVDITDGNPVDLNMFFPDIISGQGIIKYDIDNNKYYVEGTDKTLKPKFNVIDLNPKNDRNKDNNNIVFKVPTQDEINELAAMPKAMVTSSLKQLEKVNIELENTDNLTSKELNILTRKKLNLQNAISKNLGRTPASLPSLRNLNEKKLTDKLNGLKTKQRFQLQNMTLEEQKKLNEEINDIEQQLQQL